MSHGPHGPTVLLPLSLVDGRATLAHPTIPSPLRPCAITEARLTPFAEVCWPS